MQILNDKKHRLNLALPQYEPLDRLQGALLALRRIQILPLLILNRRVQERQERRQRRL